MKINRLVPGMVIDTFFGFYSIVNLVESNISMGRKFGYDIANIFPVILTDLMAAVIPTLLLLRAYRRYEIMKNDKNYLNK